MNNNQYDFFEFKKKYFKDVIETKNSIANQTYSGSGKKYVIKSPLTGEEITFFHETTKKDLEEYCQKIKAQQKKWADLSIKKRTAVIYNYRQLLIDNIDKLAFLVHLENGKCIDDAKAEILKAIETVQFSCSIENLGIKQIEMVSTKITCQNDLRALGIVASITPFNFPVMLPHWTIAQAIVLGNAMILKPSEKTPICASVFVELWKKAGLPDGIFNVIYGGKETVDAICEVEAIKAISFVGSTNVAKIVYKKATSNLKRILALGGAKNHLVIMPDSKNNDTINAIISSAYGMSGQRCMAASVIVLVGEEKNQEFINILATKLKSFKLSANFNLQEGLSAMIDQTSILKIQDYIKYAQQKGANIIVNGNDFKVESDKFKKGYYFGPTLIDWKNQEKHMSPDEIFGPVLEIIYADNLESAIEIVNNSPYGNAASIFTTSGKDGYDGVSAFNQGMLGINIGIPIPREPFSFGGTKMSKFGYGDITGPNANLFWTNQVKITTKWTKKTLNWMS